MKYKQLWMIEDTVEICSDTHPTLKERDLGNLRQALIYAILMRLPRIGLYGGFLVTCEEGGRIRVSKDFAPGSDDFIEDRINHRCYATKLCDYIWNSKIKQH